MALKYQQEYRSPVAKNLVSGGREHLVNAEVVAISSIAEVKKPAFSGENA
jgi:hypothetical protein